MVDDGRAGVDYLPPGVERHAIAVAELANRLELLRGVEAVVHLAARPSVEFANDHPLEALDANVGDTLRVLLAAAEAGFDKLYQTKVSTALEEHVPKIRDNSGATVWSAMYLDTAKDMSVATSAEELAEQLHNIELLNDRTPAQRNYLAQKVQTRYWMQQCVNMGQSTELLHMLNGRDWDSADPYEMKKYIDLKIHQLSKSEKSET